MGQGAGPRWWGGAGQGAGPRWWGGAGQGAGPRQLRGGNLPAPADPAVQHRQGLWPPGNVLLLLLLTSSRSSICSFTSFLLCTSFVCPSPVLCTPSSPSLLCAGCYGTLAAVRGLLWKLAAVRGLLWKLAAVCGLLWKLAAVCGLLWKLAAVRGLLWDASCCARAAVEAS